MEIGFSGFQRDRNLKFWQLWCNFQNIPGLLQTSRFELLGGWNVCICEIHQEHTEKKTGTENSDIFISGKETKYWVECPASSEIFQKIQIPITKP